jgi:hypothetical protein
VFKICPRCGEEFQLTASRCSDCDVELGFAREPAPAPPPPAAAADAEWVLLQRESAWYLRELAEALGDHGIASRIQREPGGLGIYVGSGDAEAAHAVAREFTEARLPGLEADPAAHDPSGCPACGEPLAADASACAACGLEFPEAAG